MRCHETRMKLQGKVKQEQNLGNGLSWITWKRPAVKLSQLKKMIKVA